MNTEHVWADEGFGEAFNIERDRYNGGQRELETSNIKDLSFIKLIILKEGEDESA